MSYLSVTCRHRQRLGAALVGVAIALAAGCGGNDQPALTGDNDTTAGDNAAAPATNLTIVGKDIAFSPDTVTIPAGDDVTITFDNQDTVPHNLHVLAGDQGDFKTPVEAGPTTQRLTLRIDKPGRYTFQCDVHLPGMKGTLVVT